MQRSCGTHDEDVPNVHAAFDVEQVRSGRFRLLGELDLASVPTLCARLVGVKDDVEFDCAGLTFIDAAGLRLFLAVQARCEARGAKLSIVNAPSCLIRVVELTGLGATLQGARGSAA
jgi:anti-anti-sigma factor